MWVVVECFCYDYGVVLVDEVVFLFFEVWFGFFVDELLVSVIDKILISFV